MINTRVPKIITSSQYSLPTKTRDGETIYAIGDIHGRLDLLTRLLEQIDQDIADNLDVTSTIVTLGDYMDRGPDGLAVVELLRQRSANHKTTHVNIFGNHEILFHNVLDHYDSDPSIQQAGFHHWVRNGGGAVLKELGITYPDTYSIDESLRVIDQLRASVPTDGLILAWYHQNVSNYSNGDYIFVHAGIHPDVFGDDLNRYFQRSYHIEDDVCTWVRKPFITYTRPGDQQLLNSERILDKFTVVHGHSIEKPIILPHRIGIDSGAYQLHILTAVKLSGHTAQFICASLAP